MTGLVSQSRYTGRIRGNIHAGEVREGKQSEKRRGGRGGNMSKRRNEDQKVSYCTENFLDMHQIYSRI